MVAKTSYIWREVGAKALSPEGIIYVENAAAGGFVISFSSDGVQSEGGEAPTLPKLLALMMTINLGSQYGHHLMNCCKIRIDLMVAG